MGDLDGPTSIGWACDGMTFDANGSEYDEPIFFGEGPEDNIGMGGESVLPENRGLEQQRRSNLV